MNFIFGVIVGYFLAIAILSSGVKNFQEICQNPLTNCLKYDIINTERKKGTAKPLGKIKMFWINVTRKEQTTDEAKVAEWVKNGDEIDIYTWCDPCGCYIQAKFN